MISEAVAYSNERADEERLFVSKRIGLGKEVKQHISLVKHAKQATDEGVVGRDQKVDCISHFT